MQRALGVDIARRDAANALPGVRIMWNGQKSWNGELGAPAGEARKATHGPAVWIWIERIVLVSGLSLLALYGLARIESFFGSKLELIKFIALDSARVGRSVAGDVDTFPGANPPEFDFYLSDEEPIKANTNTEIPTAEPDSPLAVLRISKINLEVPVLDGTDDLTLNHAVGRIAGTARPGEDGNIGIAGHRDSFFRGLKDVDAGDVIELRTLHGTDTYVVERIQIVTPDRVDVLQPRSVPSLTLVTCYPFYFLGSAPKRYIVTASLKREMKGGSENLTLGLPSQTQSLKGERK
jgi:sortase A